MLCSQNLQKRTPNKIQMGAGLLGCWGVGVLVGPGSAFVIFSFQSIYIGYTRYIVGLLVVYEQITNAWSGEIEK